MKRFIVFICALFMCVVAYAAQCPENYYVDGQTCTACPAEYPNSDGNGSSCYSNVKTRTCNAPTGCITTDTCEYTEYCNGIEIVPGELPWEQTINCSEIVISGCTSCDATTIKGSPGYIVVGDACEQCPPGTISQNDSVLPWEEPPNECIPCADGMFVHNNNCLTKCDNGYYNEFNYPNGTCVKCPDEYPNSDYNAVGISDCYSDVKIRECPAQSGCITSASSCEYRTACTELYPWGACITEFIASGCSDCSELISALPGYRVVDDVCEQCPSDTYSAGGAVTECVQCPDNSTSAAGASSCTCNSGYNKYSDKCEELCDGGRALMSSTGLNIPIYQTQLTHPAIGVQLSTNPNACFIPLESGQQSGTINVEINGTTYHAVK